MWWIVALVLAAGCGRISFEPVLDSRTDDGSSANDTSAACTPMVAGPTYDPCDANGLVACYRFDDDTFDSSPNSNHATTQNVTFGAGHHAEAIYIGATSDIAVAPSTDFLVGAFTIDTWIWFDSLPSGANIMTVFDYDTNYSLQIEPDGRFSCYAPLVTFAFSAQTMTTGRWIHLACTWDGSETDVFIDGVHDGSATGTSGPLNASGAIGLGVEAPSPGNQVIGRLDSMRIWDIVLSESDICAAMH